MTGKETVNSDKRHGNVPDGLPDIGLLMSAPLPPAAEQWKARRGKHEATAAQKARWRGWSEVMFETYGEVIKLMEAHLNDMLVAGELSPTWKKGRKVEVLGVTPAYWGGAGDALTEADVLRVANCWYPVYAMGYNWLESNGTSAKKLARRIDEIIGMYTANGRQCKKVIVVTHSMGGLVARALLHPDYGNAQDKILGVYHSVQPALGAGAAYKRVRTGSDVQDNLVGDIARNVMGRTGKEVTAVFANASGPLELLPTASYPRGWMRLHTRDYRQEHQGPVSPHDLCELRRRQFAEILWQRNLAGGHHRSGTAWRPAYVDVRKRGCRGPIVVRTRSNQPLTLRLEPPVDAGDQTVPAKASAEAVRGALFRQTGYEHQGSYQNDQVLASALYSIIRIANTATWWGQ